LKWKIKVKKYSWGETASKFKLLRDKAKLNVLKTSESTFLTLDNNENDIFEKFEC